MSSGGVVFDVDGVLLDSLPQHLRFCEDMAQELGLDLRVPDVRGFRELARTGKQMAPMEDLLRSVGFPKLAAARAVEVYERTFADEYAVCSFPGTRLATGLLRENGYKLGIVTSNTWGNVSAALGEILSHFQKNCILTRDDRLSKEQGLAVCAEELRCGGQGPMLYVGDQNKDRLAAELAGIPFLGVTYGWEISSADCATVDCAVDIAAWVLGTERAKPKVYLATPGAFPGGTGATAAREAEICSTLGFEAVLPKEEEVSRDNRNPIGLAVRRGRRNWESIRSCDLLVADLTQTTTWRERSAVAERVAFAVEQGIPAWVYSDESGEWIPRESDRPWEEGGKPRDAEARSDKGRVTVWEFDVACPGGRLILGKPPEGPRERISGLEQCLHAARRAFLFDRA